MPACAGDRRRRDPVRRRLGTADLRAGVDRERILTVDLEHEVRDFA